jgi:hypothetical protein
MEKERMRTRPRKKGTNRKTTNDAEGAYMATVTKQRVEVSVNVMEKSVTYMANTVFQLGYRIAKGRGLSPEYITRSRDILERGFFTWLAEQTLLSLHFEIISPEGAKALERWDVSFAYSASPNLEVRKPPVDEVERVCAKLRSLPPGTYYRVLVTTKPGASKVEGWNDASFLPFTQAKEQDLSGWGYGHIGAKLMYREGTW